jgi:RNA polymerase sigma-70 factor (ECF subfamily)
MPVPSADPAASGRSEASADSALMLRLRTGDREALEPLMERHYRRLFRLALSYLRNADDALDVVQETFVKAYENAHRWQPDAAVAPWLTRIAVNQAIDRYRRERRRRAVMEPLPEGDHGGELTAPMPSPEQGVRGREMGERIASAVGGLPERQRAVFLLRHREEMSLEQIGRTLGLNLGTVKSSLHRALARLRIALEGVHG